MTMTARVTVTCSGRDRAGQPTHERTVIADLGMDSTVGIVLMPTAQQRGNPQAGRPHAFGGDLRCWLCGDAVRIALRRLRLRMAKANGAGLYELPLHLLRA